MKLNVIIPMAGYGERFKKAGYDTYKPFIIIKNKPMIDYVIEAFPNEVTKYIIINPESINSEQKEYLNKKDNVILIEVTPHKKGPSYSIYSARNELPLNESFFIAYSDIYWTWDFDEVRKLLDYDGIVFTRRKFHPHLIDNNFSGFCKPREDNPNILYEIKEKGSFTNDWMNEPLSVGTFYIKSGRELIEAIENDIKTNNTAANEFFSTTPFNHLLKKNKTVYLSDVDFFIHWGIPAQLEDFNFWKGVIEKNSRKNNLTDIKNICSMGGLGKRMKEISNKPKALLDIEGIPMYQFVMKKFSSKENIFITTDEVYKELSKYNTNEYKIINIGEQTKSQLDTIKKSKKEFIESNNFFLTSCDAYGIFDMDDLKNFIKDNNPDAIIFSFNPTLLQSKSKGHHTFISQQDNKVTAVHIKSKSSNDDVGLAGFFWFKKGELFNELDNIPKDEKNEMCADHILKHLVNIRKKVMSYTLPYYIHLGTVDEYKEFKFWNSYNKILR